MEGGQVSPAWRAPSVVEVRRDLYRDLFFAERARRESIRGSIGTPTAAAAFAIFNLSTIARELVEACVLSVAGFAMMGFAVASIVLMVLAVYNVVMVEMNFVYHEPPDLKELAATEQRIRARRPDADEASIGREMQDIVTGAFSIAYDRYFSGNERGARSRTLAVRLVLFSLVAMLPCFALMPLLPTGC